MKGGDQPHVFAGLLPLGFRHGAEAVEQSREGGDHGHAPTRLGGQMQRASALYPDTAPLKSIFRLNNRDWPARKEPAFLIDKRSFYY